jgi:benzoyl-CoA reductase subunit BamC
LEAIEERLAVEDKSKQKIKAIHVDVDKCTGCRACEMACSAFHAVPRYSSTNPAKARIHVMVDDAKDAYVPIRSGHYTPAECIGRYAYTINGKVYSECGFCKAACPSRGYFSAPDAAFALRCDMCAAEPPLDVPMCVQVCQSDALTYIEREETGEDIGSVAELDAGLQRLAQKHGLSKMERIIDRMAKTGKPASR